MLKLLRNHSESIRLASKLIALVLFCTGTVAGITAVTALIILKTDFTYQSLPVITAAVLAVSAFINGFVISRSAKENGLVWGVFAAVTTLLLLAAVSAYTDRFSFSSTFLIRLAIIFIAGAAGGITGVNMS